MGFWILCQQHGCVKNPLFEKKLPATHPKRLPQLPQPRPFHRRRVRISHDSEYSIIYAIYALAPWAETTSSHRSREHLAVCQNLVPLVNIKIAGKWMFILLKMVLIGIDPYPSLFGAGDGCFFGGATTRQAPHQIRMPSTLQEAMRQYPVGQGKTRAFWRAFWRGSPYGWKGYMGIQPIIKVISWDLM